MKCFYKNNEFIVSQENFIMPIFSFHCTFGVLTYNQILSLLVWMFEIPPSKINITNCKVEVPVTPTTKQIYVNCMKHGSYRCSAPKLISTPFGIVLRKFNVTSSEFVPDQTGYNMLCAMSGGHTVPAEWNESKHIWEMTTGLGYRNTGIRFPITATEKFKKPGNRTGIGFTGMVGRDEEDPIQFVASKYDISDEQLHALWLAANTFV